MRSSICLTFIGFRRCTKIHINIDSLRVHQSVQPSLCPFYSQNCLHILSKVSRCTARQPTPWSGINQMWILKNSKELLDHLKSPNFNLITNIKSFDFSTLPHQKLKGRLATIIRNSFIHKNGNRRYKYLVLGREGPYFVREHSDSKSKYTEEDIIRMLEFLVDNIFVVFAGKVFQQIVGIPMGTNRAPLLADIFLYSYEAEFIQSLPSTGRKRLASQFNFTYRNIDDVLYINNPDFENYLSQMYPLNLRSKTRRRATLLLPSWIYSCQSVGTVNFKLPFTTSVTILISILQTFRS